MATVYQVNKSINKSIEFKGLKAQYIWYMGGSLVALLILFAVLYICGVNGVVCMVVVFGLGFFLIVWIYRLSKKYGEHGIMKKIARRQIPENILIGNRQAFCFNKN